MGNKSTRIFSDYQEALIVDAIKASELMTSGEIRVHIEIECPEPNPVKRASTLFFALGMDKTKDRNGVLFYLAYGSRKFAVVGDKGIHEKVGKDFWEIVKQESIEAFKNGYLVEGLIASINKCGQELKRFFPYYDGDKDELPNQISY